MTGPEGNSENLNLSRDKLEVEGNIEILKGQYGRVQVGARQEKTATLFFS